jgi:hypothetical protein
MCVGERKDLGILGDLGIFTVAITCSSLASLDLIFLGMVCVEMGLLFVFALGSFLLRELFLSLFLVDK